MRLFKAVAAFCAALLTHDECDHPHVAPSGTSSSGTRKSSAAFCTQCGYKIMALWSLCRCRTCGGKRQPRRGMDGKIRPLYRYCQHCGQTDFQLIKRERIHAHELPYAILTKEIDYTEERRTTPQQAARSDNPFEAAYRTLNIVEGEVLRREETLTRSNQRSRNGGAF